MEPKRGSPLNTAPRANARSRNYRHQAALPEQVTADKGYWSTECVDDIRGEVELVAISKKGRRNSLEDERELDPLFRMAQAFRAGVEGSISFLKRCLGLARCMAKGWSHYASTVGATVVAHNLIILARC